MVDALVSNTCDFTVVRVRVSLPAPSQALRKTGALFFSRFCFIRAGGGTTRDRTGAARRTLMQFHSKGSGVGHKNVTFAAHGSWLRTVEFSAL